VTRTHRERRAQLQKQQVDACMRAMPDVLNPLRETILHAPNVALEAVADALEQTYGAPQRMDAILRWLGHGEGCPVCEMLVGKLVFLFAEPIQRLDAALAARDDAALVDGACIFLGEFLRLRHARPAGVSSRRLDELRDEVRALPDSVKQRLTARLAHRGDAGDLATLL
jgi:hypothetical protein